MAAVLEVRVCERGVSADVCVGASYGGSQALSRRHEGGSPEAFRELGGGEEVGGPQLPPKLQAKGPSQGWRYCKCTPYSSTTC